MSSVLNIHISKMTNKHFSVKMVSGVMEPAADSWLMVAPPPPLCSADIWLMNGASAATGASAINEMVNRSGAAVHQLSFGSVGSKFRPEVDGAAEALLWRRHRSSSAASNDTNQWTLLGCWAIYWFVDEMKGNIVKNKDCVDDED